MSFIKIDQPVYEVYLPISKKKIKFRPFLSKEDKVLLLAKESKDSDDINNAIKQVLQNCIVTENIDVNNLPTIDIEVYYFNLSARSKGQMYEAKYVCQHLVDGLECGNILSLEVDLLNIEIPNIDIDYNIRLTDNHGIVMKYPELSIIDKVKQFHSDVSIIYPLIANCIDYGYNENNVFYSKDASEEELTIFLESLTREQLYKIVDWFGDLPAIKKQYSIACDKCGSVHSVKLESLFDFFT